MRTSKALSRERRHRGESKASGLEIIAMLRLLLHAKRSIFVVVVCTFSCALIGCLESSFDLADESRLPKGLATPPGVTRRDVSVTLDFYTPGPAQLILRDKSGRKLASVTGDVQGAPIYLKAPPDPLTPAYEIIVINGVTEIVECIPYRDGANMTRNGEIVARFKVVDDPTLRKQLLAASGLH